MQIQVKCDCGAIDCKEWAIIELQGVVESQPSINKLAGLEIGRLCCVDQQNYTFTVGYHELTGSRIPLKKPLLVLRKKMTTESEAELEVIGIIRHRILFKNRPKALISKPQSRNGKCTGAKDSLK